MAMMDYGAIAFKNRKLISTDMFTDMEKTCGWSDENENLYENEESFDGNFFVICGDKDFIVGFYKTRIMWWSKKEKRLCEEYNYPCCEYLGSSNYKDWKRWNKHFFTDSEDDPMINIEVKPRNGYYVARWTYKGDRYKVYFGYGVDYGSYKRYRIVNYYRSLPFHIHKIPYKIKWKIAEIRQK